MNKPKVFVTKRIPDAGMALLRSRFEAACFEGDGPIPRAALLEGAKGASALVSLLTDPVDAAVMDAGLPELRIIANLAVGFDNIDIEGATARGIWATNTPGVLTEATADLAWALILAVTRRIVSADRFLRDGRFKGWDPMLFTGSELNGKTLGIIGLGRIGKAVARRALAFGMQVVYSDPSVEADGTDPSAACRRVSFDALCAAADIVSLHAPLTPHTVGMFGREAFARMKPGAFFINTARGKLHDEKALVEALKNGPLRGAGLDVFEHEPQVDAELRHLDNVVVLPHIGSATDETRSEMARIVATNCLAALDGKRPPNALNTIESP